MGFGDYIKQSIEVIKLNTGAIGNLANDQKATGMAFLFIAIAGAASAIGTFNPVGIITNPIFMIIGMFIGVGILHILAKIFGGKGSFMGLFRPLGIALIMYWVTVIPFLGAFLSFLAGIWMIVVEVVTLKTVHQLTTAKAVIVMLIPLILIMVIAGLLLLVAGLAFFGMGMGAGAFESGALNF